MANRTIEIDGGDENSPQQNIVYRDISMVANVIPNMVVDKIVNVAAVQNSLKNIFTWMPGERIINPEFGSNIRKLLYEQITQFTEEQIVAEINQCITRWEPRVTIDGIVNSSDVNDTEDNIIRLDINYRIDGLDKIFTYQYEQNREN